MKFCHTVDMSAQRILRKSIANKCVFLQSYKGKAKQTDALITPDKRIPIVKLIAFR